MRTLHTEASALWMPKHRSPKQCSLLTIVIAMHFASEASKYASIRFLDARAPTPGEKIMHFTKRTKDAHTEYGNDSFLGAKASLSPSIRSMPSIRSSDASHGTLQAQTASNELLVILLKVLLSKGHSQPLSIRS